MNAVTEHPKFDLPELNEGEIYAGAIIAPDGTGHHVILLDGDNYDADWQTQMAWAKSIGGDLPDRVEQALLHAHLKDRFQPEWYWSNTQHASDSDYAWNQDFSNGNQNDSRKIYECRARAVRRVTIFVSAKEAFLAEILKPGEMYAGIILGKNGEPDYHLILINGQANDVNWQQAKEFSKKSGGDLPTRREQSLLFANLKEQFEDRWYWSGEQHASGSDYAWYQSFYYGDQLISLKYSECRARAVRRVTI